MSFNQLIAGLLLAVTANLSAAATITTYSDRSTFISNAGVTITENFNSYDSAVFREAPFDFGKFSVAGSGTEQSTYNTLVKNPSAADSIDGTAQLHLVTRVDENGDLLADVTFIFDQAITAFGADFRGFNNGTPRSYITAADTRIDPPVMSFEPLFYGFISDIPFTTLVFSGIYVPGQIDQFHIDNVTFSDKVPNRDVSSVPLPPSALLFLPSVFGLAFFRQRKQT